SNPYTAADVGKSIKVAGAGAGGIDLVTTISAFGSAGSITLAAAAGTGVSGAQVVWGTDDGPAIQAAFVALANTGVAPLFDYGICVVATPVGAGNPSHLAIWGTPSVTICQ